MPLFSGAFKLNPAQTTQVLEESRQTSFAQRMGTKVSMGLAGSNVKVYDQDFTGGWVATEGGAKPVEEFGLRDFDIALREWAVIVPIGKRVADADPDGVISMIKGKLGSALARAFDDLITTGAGQAGATYLNQATKSVALQGVDPASGGTYSALNAALALLAEDNKNLTGWLFDFVAEPIINSTVDTTGRPVFIDTPVTDTNAVYRQGRLLGRPAQFDKDVRTGTAGNATEVLGYAGDWSKVFWGLVNDIEISFSTEATIEIGGEMVSAYQNNLVFCRAEALLGGAVDPDAFAKLTRGTAFVPTP